MVRKLLLIVLVSVFALSNMAIADSKEKKKHYTHGKPFKKIWKTLKNHEERITNIETKLSTMEVNPAKYTINFQGCLNSHNSEGVIPYSNGTDMSQTLIWNCADYENYGGQHIELFFTSKDSECFLLRANYISEGNCDSPYVPPETPLFQATIKDFNLNQQVYEECSPFGSYCDKYYDIRYTYTIENTGNTTLFNLVGKVDLNLRSVDKKPFNIFPIDASVTEIGLEYAGWNISQPETYTVTVSLEMWDGTILDSQTKTITVIP